MRIRTAVSNIVIGGILALAPCSEAQPQKAPSSPSKAVAPSGLLAMGIRTTLEMADVSAVVGQEVTLSAKLKFGQPGVQPDNWEVGFLVDGEDWNKIRTDANSTATRKFHVPSRPPFSQGTHVIEAYFGGANWVGLGSNLRASQVKAKLFVVKAQTTMAAAVSSQVSVTPNGYEIHVGRIKLSAVVASREGKKLTTQKGRLVSFMVNGKDAGSALTNSGPCNSVYDWGNDCAAIDYVIPTSPFGVYGNLTFEAFFSSDDYYVGTSAKSVAYRIVP